MTLVQAIAADRRNVDTQSVSRLRRLLVVALSAFACCGVAVAAASGNPQYQPAASDQAWAESILLGTKDLGVGWRGEGSGGSTATGGVGSASCSTPDESDLVVTGGSYSPSFFRGDGAYVAANAVVWQTAEHAQADWDRNIQPALMGCLAADLQAAGTKQVRIVVTGRRQLAWPALAPRSAAYRLSAVLKATVKVRKKLRKVSVRATADFIALGSGRANAYLATLWFNRRPLSDFNEQQYAMLMAQRMSLDPAAAPS
jgi:hypothetical protein